MCDSHSSQNTHERRDDSCEGKWIKAHGVEQRRK